ncbi:hypothetical protein AW736_12985 [Termitidicoccus mucosus]|uniref:Autotransporter domain-containing protein n=2 Tax=Termitidicoccus mucosus TaxID=1184151 RepID=A0A178IJY2_9BACT|nr:hypothetical protein AW736_12985 [Opitutaceae bacterium TSB47]
MSCALALGVQSIPGDAAPLNIQDGVTLDLNGQEITFDYVTSATGSVLLFNGGTLSGAGSQTWSLNGLTDATVGASRLDAGSAGLWIGHQASGARMLIGGLGSVSSASGVIGDLAGDTGAVEVGGGGRWQNTGSLFVGRSGTGTLTITESGRVSDRNGYIGFDTGGSGAVTVGGSGYWQNTTNVLVGFQGHGALTIEGSGSVTGAAGVIGGTTGGTGEATVAGGGYWQATGGFTVGNYGTGTLTIKDNGRVDSGNGNIGLYAGGVGAVTVGGSGYWRNAAGLTVGNLGSGTLTIEDSGSVSSGNSNGNIGYEAGSAGAVTVGGGGLWQDTANLFVGRSGTGALTVEDNGRVSSGNSYIGHEAGSVGAVTVSGSGHWQNGSNFLVGNSGSGTLTIEDSGSVSTSGGGRIGAGSGGVGVVTVGGSGYWRNAGNLFVGDGGTGTLAIRESGSVTVGGAYAQNAASTLAIALSGTRGAFITAASGALAGTLAVSGFSGTVAAKAGELAGSVYTIIHAPGGITGDFASVDLGGAAASPVDYVTLAYGKANGGLDYNVGYALSWFSGGTYAHGAFTLGAGESFEVDVALGDTAANAAKGWDGRSLTKLGAGTLVLSASNGYSGTTSVLGGTLALTGSGRVSDSAGVIDGGAVATITGTSAEWRSRAFAVGQTGTGALLLGDRATLVTTGTVYPGDAVNKFRTHIGQEAGSEGVVTLTGSSTWVNTAFSGSIDSRLTVGTKGKGTLNVLDGSTVTTDRLILASADGSEGAVLISGTGSKISALVGDSTKSTVSVGFSGSARLVVENGGELNTNSTGVGGFILNEAPFLGVNRGHGEVLVTGTGSVWNLVGNQLLIGDGADGVVTIADGGRFSGSDANVVVIGMAGWFGPGLQTGGSSTSGTGALHVTGAGSEFALRGDIHVGRGGAYETSASGPPPAGVTGHGTLTVADGGSVRNGGGLYVALDQYSTGTVAVTDGSLATGAGVIGYGAGGRGAVSVSGSGFWQNTGDLTVGLYGTGTLAIEGGGSVANVNGFIGDYGTSAGVVTVGGSGLWQNTGDLTVGNSGTGTLAIGGGGSVTNNNNGFIGYDVGGVGAVTVSGSGLWQNTGDLAVGYFGTGTLAIEGGGSVANNNGYIGYDAGAVGAVTVGGSGYWQNTGSLTVGRSGTGTLAIRQSGSVSSSRGYIGYTAGAVGAVAVGGSGYWENTGLTVGYYGTGTLTIRESGSVSSGYGEIGYGYGAAGVVSVSGSGYWRNTSGITVGKGMLTIEDSGSVRSSGGWIGYNGLGAVTVSGSGYWQNSNDLSVGTSGTGTLTIEGSGSVRSSGNNYIGYGAGGHGAVTVGGNGLWQNSGRLLVGYNGTGTMTIADSGSVSNLVDSYIGYQAGSVGVVTVSGSGYWQNTDSLTVGRSGTGTLAIRDSGSVAVGGTYAQNAVSTLAVALSGTRGAFVTAAGGTLSGTLSLTGLAGGTAAAKASEVAGDSRVIIHTTSGLAGDFATVTGLPGSGVDYLTGHAGVAGTDYVVDYGLSWFAGGTYAHGVFTLGSGSSFEVDVALSDTAANAAKGWDGKSLAKLGDGTLILSAASTHSGTTLVGGGTLALADLQGAGAGDVLNHAVLDLAASGTFANTLGGTGTTVLSGTGVTVGGSNALFAGVWDVRGSGTMTARENLGAGGTAAVNLGGDLSLALGAGDYTFDHALAGTGTLAVSNSGAFAFGAATGTHFAGSVIVRGNTFALGGAGVPALSNATLVIGEGNATTVAAGTQRIGNLTLESGTLRFTLDDSGTAVAGLIDTGALHVGDTVIVVDTTAFGGNLLSLLQQDDGRDIQLVKSTSRTGAAAITGAQLVDQDGQQLGDATQRDIVQNSATTALGTYDFAATASGSGLYLGYELTHLHLLDNQTTLLDHDVSDLLKPGAAELHAVISGSGHLAVNADGSAGVITLTGSNSYTGATLVTGGTLKLGTGGALGRTSLLDLAAGAAADLNGQAQAIGAFSGSAGSALLVNGGSLGVDGALAHSGTIDLGAGALTAGTFDGRNGSTLDFAGGVATLAGGGTSAGALTGGGTLALAGGNLLVTVGNTALTASTTIAGSATATLQHVAGLGVGGALTADGRLIFAAAAGTNQNAIGGAGVVSATSAANVILGGNNANFSGTWAIAADSAFKAAGAASLGTGKVADSGTLVLGGTTNYELQITNEISGAGALVKEDANAVTISHGNTHSGGSRIESGTLALGHLAALGSGTVTNTAAATLALDASGTYANTTANAGLLEVNAAGVALAGDIGGSGTNRVAAGASATVSGVNTAFTGRWDIVGEMLVGGQDHLGGAATAVSGTLRIESGTLSAWAYANALSGGGVVAAGLSGGALSFAAATGTAFTGTVRLADTRLDFGDDATGALNEQALKNATVEAGAGSTVRLARSGTIGGLAMTGGTLALAMDGLEPAHAFKTGTLAVMSGSSKVVFENFASGTMTPGAPSLPPATNFLDQDGPGAGAVRLLAADTVAQEGQMAIVREDGSAIGAGQKIDYDGVVIASYDYAAFASATNAATGQGAGLYYDYLLTELDIQQGKTLTLDDAGAADTVLDARVTGSGHLQISATGAITLGNSANDYTGATLVAGGTLITGASGALGATSLLSLSSLASLDLNATAQTLGALDTAAGSTLALDTGTLAIVNGGTAAGALTGSGLLELQGGTLTVTAANPGLGAGIAIAAPATADLKHAGALGGGTIALDGTLKLDLAPAASGTFANALAGAGSLLKTGGGTAVIVTTNTGFTGAARVADGRLVLENLSALGAAPVSVDAGATLEYRNVGGAMGNVVSGPGTLAITTSGSFAIAHDNAVANVGLTGAAVYLGATGALGGSTASVVADAHSAIWLAVDNARLGATTLNGAKLGFVHSGSAFRKATLAGLAGDNATLVFNADFTGVSGLKGGGEVADHITITGGSAASAHTVEVNALGGLPGNGEAAIPLIADGGLAVYRLAGGRLDFGLMQFEFARGGEADSSLGLDPDQWYLFSTGLSDAADAIINTASILGKDWHYALDTLYLRLGEVRAEYLPAAGPVGPDLVSGREHTAASARPLANRGATQGRALQHAPTGNVWVRARGYHLTAGNELSGRGFEQYAYGVTAGGDKAFLAENSVNLVGGFVDMGRIDRDFDGADNTGGTGSVSVGLYGTWLHGNGWYADLVFKADRYKHSLDVRTAGGRTVSADYDSEAQGVSLELGRRLERGNGWWVEPAVRASVAWLNGASYRTSPENVALEVKVDASRAAQYRGAVRFGKRLRDSRWAPYGKFGMVKSDTDGGAIHAHDREFEPDYDGWRFEAGLGAGYLVNERSQVYFDYEYGKAANYERPWAFNLGYRRLW